METINYITDLLIYHYYKIKNKIKIFFIKK